MTSLRQFQDIDRETSPSERITRTLGVLLVGAVVAMNVASLVLSLLAV